MRLNINRKMDINRTFAVWRIDSPWKPITKKGVGVRMGGGKGAINHYVTPVKADRIIVEMGGMSFLPLFAEICSPFSTAGTVQILAHNL